MQLKLYVHLVVTNLKHIQQRKKFVLIHVQTVIHSIQEDNVSQLQLVELKNSTKNTELSKKLKRWGVIPIFLWRKYGNYLVIIRFVFGLDAKF